MWLTSYHIRQVFLPTVVADVMYTAARHEFTGAVRWLVLDLGRQLGARRTAELLRGSASLADRHLRYALLSAERLTQMLAQLHIGRLLAQQAVRWPEREPLASRFLRRTFDICELNARRIRRGDRDALEAIEQWRAA